MTQIKTNKGVGRNALFKGMTKSYILTFFVSIILAYFTYAVVDNRSGSSIVGLISGIAVFAIGGGGSLYLSKRFGEKGLTQFRASKSANKYIHNKYRLSDIIADNKAYRKR